MFLSHSSKDKKYIVNPINSYLQAQGIGTWLDSYEIDYGDNIYLKVNQGIASADVGLFILTDHFFDSASGWPITEFSTFFMEAMNNKKKLLLINAGVSPENMHVMMKSFKYLTWSGLESLPEIGEAISRKLDA
ncbi:MAG TPA: toll/interleukin-1 receptor domain-containing protein [Spongiibacteraceae bacterium]|nr:toll/interleukin-1 receptor domain-containing protein [Spongiibacteraceae bacterium]